ncbi:hypothetical protein HYS49_03000 [Candidatus Woesearchaeota archaeon]|nr:hypothetical protein [Candidatus Woesearchaeota archaeon]
MTQKTPEPEEGYPHKLIIRNEAWDDLQHAQQGYLIVRQDAFRLAKNGLFLFYDLGLDFSAESNAHIPDFYSIPLITYAGTNESGLLNTLAIRQLEEPGERILVRRGAQPELYDLAYGKSGKEFQRRAFITTEEALQKATPAAREKLETLIQIHLRKYTDSLTRTYPYAICSRRLSSA